MHRRYIQAKLMFIQTGSAKFYFASATAQILNSFQNLLPIVYIIGSCRQTARRDTCQQLMFIQTVMPLFITDLRLANWFVNTMNKATSHSLYYIPLSEISQSLWEYWFPITEIFYLFLSLLFPITEIFVITF